MQQCYIAASVNKWKSCEKIPWLSLSQSMNIFFLDVNLKNNYALRVVMLLCVAVALSKFCHLWLRDFLSRGWWGNLCRFSKYWFVVIALKDVKLTWNMADVKVIRLGQINPKIVGINRLKMDKLWIYKDLCTSIKCAYGKLHLEETGCNYYKAHEAS